MARGTFGFAATGEGLADSAANVDALRRLWLDRSMIDGADLGPGDPGDFDHGAWHVGCHVVAGGGVRRTRDGRVLWLEISWDAGRGEYYASVTADGPGTPRPLRLDGGEGRALLADSTLLGFVEGTSLGRISARGVQDPPDRFNKWQRQDFDQSPDSARDGGRVWEHWCTLRDLRPSQPIATSVLRAYVTLLAALGDRFLPTVARGRRQYGHPVQLSAMVRAGLTTEAAATWETTPVAIPRDAGRLLLEGEPTAAVAAAKQLTWGDQPIYHMFRRRIRSWSTAEAVRRDLRQFRP
jgi:hypothetical protein